MVLYPILIGLLVHIVFAAVDLMAVPLFGHSRQLARLWFYGSPWVLGGTWFFMVIWCVALNLTP